MPSSKGGLGIFGLLAVVALPVPGLAYDMERDSWLLPTVNEAIRPPRETRPAYDALDFARVVRGGNELLPELAREEQAILITAAIREDRAAAEKLLDGGVNPNRPGDEYGGRALIHGVDAGDVELVRLLLKAGAEPNLRSQGMTPLGLAALRGQARIVRLLLQAGANPDLKGGDGNTPLYNAALLDHVGVIRELLPYRPDFSLTNAGLPNFEGLTALGIAALEGNTGAVEALLQGGADTEELDKSGRTALYYAVFRGHRATILRFLERGAETGGMAVDAY